MKTFECQLVSGCEGMSDKKRSETTDQGVQDTDNIFAMSTIQVQLGAFAALHPSAISLHFLCNSTASYHPKKKKMPQKLFQIKCSALPFSLLLSARSFIGLEKPIFSIGILPKVLGSDINTHTFPPKIKVQVVLYERFIYLCVCPYFSHWREVGKNLISQTSVHQSVQRCVMCVYYYNLKYVGDDGSYLKASAP